MRTRRQKIQLELALGPAAKGEAQSARGDSPRFVKRGALLTRRASRGTIVALTGGIEQGLAFQHGAGDAEQPVADTAQGSRMAMPAGAQGGVFRLADRVALSRHPGPVVDGVLQAVVSGQPADDDQRFA